MIWLWLHIIHTRTSFLRVRNRLFSSLIRNAKVNLLSYKNYHTTGYNLLHTGLRVLILVTCIVPTHCQHVRELLWTVAWDYGFNGAYLLNTMIPRSERSSFISSKVSWTSSRCRVLRWAAKVSFLVSATVLVLPISVGHRYREHYHKFSIQVQFHILQVSGQPLN